MLITANRDYYALDRVPEFWEWLVYHGNQGSVKVPIEIMEEIRDGTDALAAWSSDSAHLEALCLDEEAQVGLVQRVINEGYARDLADHEIEKIGRDPFLIAYALRARFERCVVTTEVSKPSRQRANRHIPDVCRQFDIT